MNIGPDFTVLADAAAPKGRRIVRIAHTVSHDGAVDQALAADYWGGEEYSDFQLRNAIKAATGTAPGPRSSRASLIARFDALNKQLAAQ